MRKNINDMITDDAPRQDERGWWFRTIRNELSGPWATKWDAIEAQIKDGEPATIKGREGMEDQT